MPETVTCSRCGRTAPGLVKPPLPGALGREVEAGVCADCWAEWQGMEVMVINELRLDFMDPAAQKVLEEHMRQFFVLESGPAPPAA